MLRLLTIAGLLAIAGAAHAAEAGRIVFVTGQAHAAGHVVTLGDAVQEGDEISTGPDGYIYMKTVDNGFLILRPGSKARVVAYHVDAHNPANTRVKFELLNGVARAISGEGVKQARQNFRFNTPVAAIGVRGTDFTVFTDQQTSRIAVISGGVVVSGFSGNCGPEGGGPCEGSTSRELFADQKGQLLQIQKGQPVPQIVRNAANLSPDLSAPPRNDEPVGKTSSSGAAAATPSDYNLDPKKNKDLLENAKLPTPVPRTPPSVPDNPLPPVVVPKAPEVIWGRWEAVANLPADSEVLAKLKNGGYEIGTVVGSFVISRIKDTEFVLPKEGVASFRLTNSEAYIRQAGQAPVAATVQNSRLDVDFAATAFSTSLTVVGAGNRVDINAKGDVTYKGELVSSLLGSNAVVRGYLGGVSAKEAAYIFSSTGGAGVSVFGATSWSR